MYAAAMLYFNQAGTSWPKPEPVRRAVAEALEAPPEEWGDRFDRLHREVAGRFGIADPGRLLLTPGATSALAVAIRDHPWAVGDRLLVSSWEHHAVHRPAQQLEAMGVRVDVIPPGEGGPLALGALEAELRRGRVRLVAMTAASNVTGDLLPVDDILGLCRRYDALFLLDAAQVAGWMPLDVAASGVDLLAFTGHKGPQGIWGIGGLYVSPDVQLASPEASCEVGRSPGAVCAPMPGYCDVGSVDRAALAGLVAGLEWLEQADQRDRLARARARIEVVESYLSTVEDVTIHRTTPAPVRMPAVAFTHRRSSPAGLASRLADRGIMVGSGLQCAPLAHRTLGTEPDGVVRVSFGPGNAPGEEEALVDALRTVLG